MVPKAAFDALQEQLSILQATVDRLTALLEEKEQIHPESEPGTVWTEQ